MQRVMDGNAAASYVSYAFTELAGIYPITPSSPMAENIDKMSSRGIKNFFGNTVKVVEMQSEAGAAAFLHGALQNGALASTYTASQGLLLMIPTMYKLAGEEMPAVFNVAARSLSTNALSIFGDHQDIYAARSTGFSFIAASSPQSVMDLTAVSYLSAIKSSMPFVSFFDGFRTSHELQKIDLIDLDKVKALIDKEALDNFRKRALAMSNITLGTNLNDDIYFQMQEVQNKNYDKVIAAVKYYMEEISKLTGRAYKPYTYYGKQNATKLIVAMGSVTETIKEVVDEIEGAALLEVHLFRPFSINDFLGEIPESIKGIAVLERTKEKTSREALFLDVLNAVNKLDRKIKVIGGRYGLSSKNTTPEDIAAVYQYLDNPVNDEFTIGIKDDLNNLSLDPVPINIHKKQKEILIYGFGSDGMVSSSKDLIHIIGDNTNLYTQGYFQYDSNKSGSLTRSHLRFSEDLIKSTYYVKNPDIVMSTKDSYLSNLSILENIKEGGTLILNSIFNAEEINKMMLKETKQMILEKKIKVYYINAYKIAHAHNLNNHINRIMEYALLKELNIFDEAKAKFLIEEGIRKAFMHKSIDLVNNNILALNDALNSIKELDTSKLTIDGESLGNDLFDMLDSKRGDKLSTKDLYPYKDGRFIGGGSLKGQKLIAENVPIYNMLNCITCNRCAFVCPHGVIRPFLLSQEEYKEAPALIKSRCIKALIPKEDYYFTIGVAYKSCTGCGVCVSRCPGKNGAKALTMMPTEMALTDSFREINDYLFTHIKDKDISIKTGVKFSQFKTPTFSFPGACAGCGETPYLRLLSQITDNLVIANATGCSSIYGGAVPRTPYKTPWASSLFEDTAEFGYGIMEAGKLLNKDADYWVIGGDGWAYDIGYGGLDHVLASGANINVLVLDTEVYSNTGGQASKSTKKGAIAAFTSSGKKTYKKDLARIFLSYPDVYVAQISMGYDMNQTLKALKEAMEYDGPSLVIAYSPCIEHKILENSSSVQEESATESGYFPIFRYNPANKTFSLDSKADFDKYIDFLRSENRYKALENINSNYEEIYLKNKEEAERRYAFLEEMEKKYGKDI